MPIAYIENIFAPANNCVLCSLKEDEILGNCTADNHKCRTALAAKLMKKKRMSSHPWLERLRLWEGDDICT